MLITLSLEDDMKTCDECGALIDDADKHWLWHDSLAERLAVLEIKKED